MSRVIQMKSSLTCIRGIYYTLHPEGEVLYSRRQDRLDQPLVSTVAKSTLYSSVDVPCYLLFRLLWRDY